jgi:hypothetical protein
MNATTEPRGYGQILAGAVMVLTEAARTIEDFAGFLANACAGAAANLGSIDQLIAGRPGSWEADLVWQLLIGTVGDTDRDLLGHRTEPVTVRVYVDGLLVDLGMWALYDEAYRELARRRDAAEEAEDEADAAASAELLWHYDRTAEGEWVPREPGAPAWSWDAWRADARAGGTPAEAIERIEQSMRDGVQHLTDRPDPDMWTTRPRSPEAAAQLRRLDAEREARMAVYDRFEEHLDDQQQREWGAYGRAFAENVQRAARERLPSLRVPVEVQFVDDWNSDTGNSLDSSGPALWLWEQARAATPVPGSGIPPREYPPGADIAQVERDAGRTPLARLDPTSQEEPS